MNESINESMNHLFFFIRFYYLDEGGLEALAAHLPPLEDEFVHAGVVAEARGAERRLAAQVRRPEGGVGRERFHLVDEEGQRAQGREPVAGLGWFSCLFIHVCMHAFMS